jgi:hypothetical protein
LEEALLKGGRQAQRELDSTAAGCQTACVGLVSTWSAASELQHGSGAGGSCFDTASCM